MYAGQRIMFARIFKQENLNDGWRYIGSLARFTSIMIDMLVLILLLTLLMYVIDFVFSVFHTIPIESMEKVRFGLEITDLEQSQLLSYTLFLIFSQIFQLLFIFGYITFMWCRFATTPGKFLFGVRILDDKSRGRITPKQATIRFFSLLISVLPLGIGVIWSAFDHRSQAWHDKIAKTVLIIKDVK